MVTMKQPDEVVRHKKPYSPPKLRKRNREEVALILLGHAWDGDENAQELLEQGADVLFPETPKNK